jgi:hypothetical protein
MNDCLSCFLSKSSPPLLVTGRAMGFSLHALATDQSSCSSKKKMHHTHFKYTTAPKIAYLNIESSLHRGWKPIHIQYERGLK